MIQKLTPEQVVQINLNHYNNRDINEFMKSFHKEIKMYNFGDQNPIIIGLEQVRKLYQELFDLSPKLNSSIIKRITFGNIVIDHENIFGRLGSLNDTELILIYEIKGEKIIKVTVISK